MAHSLTVSMYRRLLLAAAVVAGVSLATNHQTPALTSSGLISISPPLKQLTIASGLVQAVTNITLTNGTPDDVAVAIKTTDFTPLGNGRIVLGQYGPSGAQSGLAQWMSLPDGPNLTIKAGQKTDVRLLIDNRPDLVPGGHYGAVVFSTRQVGASGPNRVAVNQQLTSLFFVKKVGGDIARMTLESIKVDSNSGLPTTAITIFKSTGNVYVVPHGYIEVTDAKGTLLAKGIINPESSLIPQAVSRSFDTILQPAASAKSTGRLKLTVYYRFDSQTQLKASSIYLDKQGIPTKKIIIVLVILGGLAVMIFLFFSRRQHYKFSVQSRSDKK